MDNHQRDSSSASSAKPLKLSSKALNRLLLIILLLVVMIIAQFLPLKVYLGQLLTWIKNLGAMGPLIIIVVYILSSILVMPTWYLSVGAGFILGIGWGTCTVSLGATIGACIAFIIGRTLARSWIEKWAAKNDKYQQFDEIIGEDGFKLVLLMRLGPLFPYNLLNYAASLTKITFWKYSLATWMGMLPASLMYVYFGSAARSLSEVTTGSPHLTMTQQIIFWVGLVMTIIISLIITRIAANRLKQVGGKK